MFKKKCGLEWRVVLTADVLSIVISCFHHHRTADRPPLGSDFIFENWQVVSHIYHRGTWRFLLGVLRHHHTVERDAEKNVFIWQQGIWVIRSSNSFQIRALLGCFSPQAEIHSASRMRSWHLFMLLLALERSVREKTSIPTWILKEMKQDVPCWCWADII